MTRALWISNLIIYAGFIALIFVLVSGCTQKQNDSSTNGYEIYCIDNVEYILFYQKTALAAYTRDGEIKNCGLVGRR